MNKYKCFGLAVDSDIELHNLPKVHGGISTPEILIRHGAVDGTLRGARECDGYAQITPGRCVLTIPEVARFEIADGSRVIVDPLPESSRHAIEAYLLGTVLGVLIHQRMECPLHVSAVHGKQGGVAFTGPSGAGKSTIVAGLSALNHLKLLSDDVGRVLVGSESQVEFFSGPRKLKLWKDAADWLQMSPQNRIRDIAREDKFHFGTEDKAWGGRAKLKALVYLRRSREETVCLKRATGQDALKIVFTALYRPTIGVHIHGQAGLFLQLSKIASLLDVYMLSRPWGFDSFHLAHDALKEADLV